MRGQVGIGMVVRQLEAWQHDQAVLPQSARRLAGDVLEVEPVVAGMDAARRRGGVDGARDAQRVIGDAEDVEPSLP